MATDTETIAVAARLGRPFVTLKWASSLDGRIAAADGSSRWITGAPSRRVVHDQRASADAIAVGTGTVLADDPVLTARGGDGELLPRQPLPVVIGERAVPASARLRAHPRGFVETGTRDLAVILRGLAARGIRHLFVEGGPTLATAFTRAGFVDEFSIDLAPALLGGPMLATRDLGVTSIDDTIRLTLDRVELIGQDIHVLARPERPPASLRPATPAATPTSRDRRGTVERTT